MARKREPGRGDHMCKIPQQVGGTKRSWRWEQNKAGQPGLMGGWRDA